MNYVLAILELVCLILGLVYVIGPLRKIFSTIFTWALTYIRKLIKAITDIFEKVCTRYNICRIIYDYYLEKEYVQDNKGINNIVLFVRIIMFLLGADLFITFPCWVFFNKQFGLALDGIFIVLLTIVKVILLFLFIAIIDSNLRKNKYGYMVYILAIIISVILVILCSSQQSSNRNNFIGFLYNSGIVVLFSTGEWVIFKILIIVIKIADGYFATAKAIDRKWHIEADIILLIITTYVFRIIRNPVCLTLEIIISLCRIVLMAIMAYLLWKLLCAIVIEAINSGLKKKHLTVLKFVLCIIFMQMAVFTTFMTEGVILSQLSSGEYNHFVFQNGECKFENVKDDFFGTKDVDSNKTELLATNEIKGLNKAKDIITFLYYIIMTYTSVGYGDIIPITVLSKIFAGIVSLSGYLTSAVVIAVLLSGIGGNKTDNSSYSKICGRCSKFRGKRKNILS